MTTTGQGYPLDADLLPGLAALPVLDIADPVAARAVVAEMVARAPATDQTGLTVRNEHAPGADGAPDVALRLYLPEGTGGPVPAAYHIHGGG